MTKEDVLYLTEIHHISKKDPRWKEIDNICFLSKNLYNSSVYYIRQYFFNNNSYVNSSGHFIFNNTSLYHALKESPDFRNGQNTKVMKSVFIQVYNVFSNYFKAKKAYNNDPSKFIKRPKLPKYKEKDGRNMITFEKGAISFKKKEGHIHLSMTNIFIKTNRKKGEIVEVRLIPTNLNYYQIEVVYKTLKAQKIQSPISAGIDPGINNILSLASNDPSIPSVIINGRPVKHINSSYNKLLARKKSKLPKNVYTSKKIKHVTRKRNNRINDYLHKISKTIILYSVANNISELVIGNNKGWKQKVNLGKRSNQNFVSIPYNKLFFYLKYKGEKYGVDVKTNEESYTSKCSFLDMEKICKHTEYQGKRSKRGLFNSSKGININADINGALNILRKEKGNGVFQYNRNIPDSICVFAVSPAKVNIPLRGILKLAK